MNIERGNAVLIDLGDSANRSLVDGKFRLSRKNESLNTY